MLAIVCNFNGSEIKLFHGEFVNNLPKVAIINVKVYCKPVDNSLLHLFTAVASNVNNFQTVFHAASLLYFGESERAEHNEFLCSRELFQFTTHNKSSAQKHVVFQTNKCSSRTKISFREVRLFQRTVNYFNIIFL